MISLFTRYNLISLTIIYMHICFVCTHKIQAEEECLSSNILCYDCDSRYDPNCADPFDFSSLFQRDQPDAQAGNSSSEEQPTTEVITAMTINSNRQQDVQLNPNSAPTINSTSLRKKKLPAFATCHGCCVKITRRTPDGANFVRRTCTTNLQINYFMVGLVCMKESGDRGRMCFCETDFCNGQPGLGPQVWTVMLAAIVSFVRILPANQIKIHETRFL